MSEELIKQEEAQEVAAQVVVEENSETPAEGVAALEAPAAEALAEEAPAAEETVRAVPETKADVVARLKEIVHEGGKADRSELDALKQTFYRLLHAEQQAAREAFIAGGGEAEAYVQEPDADEENFKAQMGLIKELRAKAIAEEEELKKQNLERKLAIIEKIKEMTAAPDVADKNYEEFKQLVAEWKEIKQVPAENVTELWKNFQLYVEQFYDILRLNHEMRAYDFKKNLEIKTRLCEAAEKLAEVADPVSAFHQLQNLHNEWREAGPVAKELREELWGRFKEASTVINKRHQEHFEGLKAQEEENLQKKTALCEKVEGIDVEAFKSFADWDAASKLVIVWENEWKTIGFPPRKMNTKILERFRAACDAFFQKKSAHFKNQRDTLSANLAARTALCEQAEALKDSTEWVATANKIIALQAAWKKTGPVAHKVSETVWKRFNDACNYFFDRKNEATSGQRKEEEANLEKKNALIDALEKLIEEAGENIQEAVRDLQAQWNEIGHVPFRKKDKVYKRYRDALDKIYKEHRISAGRRNLENFKNNVAEKAGSELSREFERLQRAFEAKKTEIANYETNLLFFNSKSKSGNSLVADVQKKVERLKEDLAQITEKIKVVREQLSAEK